MKRLLLLLAVLTMGCSIPRTEPEGGPGPGQVINSTAKVLILAVQDGQEQGEKPANGSGKAMVAALGKVLMGHSVPFSTTETLSNIQGFEDAEKIGFDYVMKCTYTLWEHNLTAWTGKGDKVKISIEVLDVKTKQLVGVAGFYRVGTGFTLASGTPDRFIVECAEGALSKLYGWPIKN